MKKGLILLIFFLINSSIVLSQKIITGLVRDTNLEPLIGVNICQGNADNCVISDFDGVFHLSLTDKYDNVLNFNYIGYKSVKISSVDTLQKLLVVTMEIDSLATFGDPNTRFDPSHKGWGFTAFFQIDMIENNFSQFSNPLGDYNII
jgi:hypothetical protein